MSQVACARVNAAHLQCAAGTASCMFWGEGVARVWIHSWLWAVNGGVKYTRQHHKLVVWEVLGLLSWQSGVVSLAGCCQGSAGVSLDQLHRSAGTTAVTPVGRYRRLASAVLRQCSAVLRSARPVSGTGVELRS